MTKQVGIFRTGPSTEIAVNADHVVYIRDAGSGKVNLVLTNGETHTVQTSLGDALAALDFQLGTQIARERSQRFTR